MSLKRGITVSGLAGDATRTAQVHLKSSSENRYFFGIGNKGGKASQDSNTTSKTDRLGLGGSKIPSSSGEENGADNSLLPELVAGSEDKLQLLRKLVTKKNA